MRIACISDIHGNIYALEKVLKILEHQNIDEIIFMGDAVGYIPGTQVIRRLKELEITCLMGNHEDMLLKGTYSPEKDKFYQHSKTSKMLLKNEIEYISSWPDQLLRDGIAFFHASPNDHLYEYIYPDTDLDIYCSMLNNVQYCVVGHTHRPFIRKHDNIMFVNTGSVGLPRDDGRYGAFAIIDTLTESAKIMRFDITAETMQSITEFGPVHNSVLNLTKRLAKNSITGEMLND